MELVSKLNSIFLNVNLIFVNVFLSVWDDYYAFDYEDLAKMWSNHHDHGFIND